MSDRAESEPAATVADAYSEASDALSDLAESLDQMADLIRMLASSGGANDQVGGALCAVALLVDSHRIAMVNECHRYDRMVEVLRPTSAPIAFPGPAQPR